MESMAGVICAPSAGRTFSNGVGQGVVKVEPSVSPGFAIFASELPAGSGGPPQHVHALYDEAWFVIDGELEFRIDGRPTRCGEGSLVSVPRGVSHTFSNPGEQPAHVL